MKKILLLLAGAAFLCSCQQPEKTAFVNNSMLTKNYNGIIEWNKRFEQKRDKLEQLNQADGQELQQKIQKFQKEAPKLSQATAKERREKLLKEQQQFQQSVRAQQVALSQQRQHVQDSLMDVIKTTIEQIAKSNSYVYVFGANEDQNLFYGEESHDITQDVLEKLNGEKISKDSLVK